MGLSLLTDSTIKRIADAVRTKLGRSDALLVRDIPDHIMNISSQQTAAFCHVIWMKGTAASVTDGTTTISIGESGDNVVPLPHDGLWTVTAGDVVKTFTVNYGEAITIGASKYLPNTIDAAIIEAIPDNFTGPTDTMLGDFVRYNKSSVTGYVENDYIVTNNNYFYDIGESKSVTAYIVVRPRDTNLQRLLTLSSTIDPSDPDIGCFFVEGSLYMYNGGNHSTSINTSAKVLEQPICMAISFNDTANTVKYYLNGELIATFSGKSASLRYVNYNGTGSSYARVAELYYLALVDMAETDNVIRTNQQNLMDRFGILSA